jgi:hypothetical protein
VLDLGDERGPQILMDIDRSSADFDHQLEQDLAFLRTWNSGSEHMPESARARVRAIARKYGWLSADHRTESLITADELRHLTIASGTLSPEERDTIDNHVTSTIRMLEELPYPKKLRNIPLAAGSHHERMDGKGYPRGLAGDQIPIAGRIIGIADIFEALTATDRPYKKPNSLPEALRILKNMVESGHIDPDLYDVFMNEKIYLRYAEAHPKMAGRLDAGGDDVLSAAAEA